MNKKISTVLIVISVIIIVFGIFAGISVATGLITKIGPIENIYIDGADFTGVVQVFSSVFFVIVGLVVVGYSISCVAYIWCIYGLVMLVVRIVKKHKNKNNIEKKKE